VPSDNLQVREQVALHTLSTLGVGGPARWFLTATRPEHVSAAHRWALDRGVPVFVLGGGSNIVIADTGVDGLVLQMGIGGVTTTPDGGKTLLVAGAGEPWDRIVDLATQRGLAGIECLSGIPGTVGGTPIQNVGAYGQEVADVIDRVTVFDRPSSEFAEIQHDQCGFSYRMSRFKAQDQGRFIVCGVTFRLPPAAPRAVYPDLVAELETRGLRSPGLLDVRDAVRAIRRRKGMVLDDDDPDTRSVGSFFVNPIVTVDDQERISALAGTRAPGFVAGEGRVKIPAAWLIERSGLGRGHADGRVGISSKHPLAIVNRGGATAREVLQFAARVKRAVIDWCGVWLTTEPVFVGLEGDADAGFLQKARD